MGDSETVEIQILGTDFLRIFDRLFNNQLKFDGVKPLFLCNWNL